MVPGTATEPFTAFFMQSNFLLVPMLQTAKASESDVSKPSNESIFEAWTRG